jgi:hypothetical protein
MQGAQQFADRDDIKDVFDNSTRNCHMTDASNTGELLQPQVQTRQEKNITSLSLRYLDLTYTLHSATVWPSTPIWQQVKRYPLDEIMYSLVPILPLISTFPAKCCSSS